MGLVPIYFPPNLTTMDLKNGTVIKPDVSKSPIKSNVCSVFWFFLLVREVLLRYNGCFCEL